MKIIYTLNNFLPQQVAGTEVYVFTLAKAMQQKGNNVTVLIPNFGRSVNESYTYENINVIKFAEPTVLSRALIAGDVAPVGLLFFTNILKDFNPDIIHFHTVGGSNGVSLHHLREAKKSSASILITFHLAGYTCKTNNLLFTNKVPCNGFIDVMRCTRCVFTDKGITGVKKNILYPVAATAYALQYNARQWNNTIGTAVGYPYVIKKLKDDLHEMAILADKIIVLTKWYKNVLEINNVAPQKLEYISQGLGGKSFPIIIKNNITVLKLVFVGRINESKGLHLLLQAIKEIPEEKIMLDIFGPVTDEKYADQWKSFTTAKKNIKWMGVIEPSYMVSTLTNYHLLCLPSVICEMSPLVIQEAFAAGVPVLASNVYGNAEQITDGENGWLFKFNDVNDLKNKLQQLINDPLLIEKASLHIAPVKSFDTVADEHEKLYKEIVEAV